MSTRYAAALRGIQHLLRALNIASDVILLDGVDHHEVDPHAQQVFKFIE
jgi:hypothetical protein